MHSVGDVQLRKFEQNFRGTMRFWSVGLDCKIVVVGLY